jgi:hypothetical protein
MGNNGTPAHEIARDYRVRAQAERDAGGSCTINMHLPEVSITMSDGQVWYYQEWQADEVLNEARETMRDTGIGDYLAVEDYLLATFQNA